MFGYVRPPLQALPQEEQDRFRRAYCGLCHTLSRRCGFAARFILNYDFTFLAILLSDGEEQSCACGRCVASPLKKRPYCAGSPALDLAADESVILAWWQMQDHIADCAFFRGLKYRAAALFLARPYRRAAKARPEFEQATRRQLSRLAELETGDCASIDLAADTFAELLAAAADEVEAGNRRRILRQMLYHLGRWIYLIDAADDLKKDVASGNYNPLIPRYGLKDGVLDAKSREAFTQTLDHSIRLMATAYELWDFGCWSPILEHTIYASLFHVGKAVLDGTFHTSVWKNKKDKIVEEST